MPKMKSHRGAAKRFKKTGTGKLVRNKAGRRHILTKKNTKLKRQMRGGQIVAAVDVKRLKQMLPSL